MTVPDWIMVLSTGTTCATVIIKAVADAFRQQRTDLKTEAQHVDLVTRNEAVVNTLDSIKTQTNGNTEKLHAAMTALQAENGRLQGILLAMRSGGRSTDPSTMPPIGKE